jgi:hypothetical protein
LLEGRTGVLAFSIGFGIGAYGKLTPEKIHLVAVGLAMAVSGHSIAGQVGRDVLAARLPTPSTGPRRRRSSPQAAVWSIQPPTHTTYGSLIERSGECTLMVDMPVIVRHQDRGALRLDHRHDQALCRRRAVI